MSEKLLSKIIKLTTNQKFQNRCPDEKNDCVIHCLKSGIFQRSAVDENSWISPFSIQTALSMATLGADNNTEKELLNVAEKNENLKNNYDGWPLSNNLRNP